MNTNFYAANVDIGAIPPWFIHPLGRSRWAIDARVFQTVVTDCRLKKPSVHRNSALVVLTLDDPVDEPTLERVRAAVQPQFLRLVRL